MELIKQNGPHCLVTSAAMCLNCTPDEIHEAIGMDGTEVWWPPRKMRGIHIQEIQDFAVSKGKVFYPVELYPEIAHDNLTEPKEIMDKSIAAIRFLKHIHARAGILITVGHACAWDGFDVLDPKGYKGTLQDYKIHEVWLLADLIGRPEKM